VTFHFVGVMPTSGIPPAPVLLVVPAPLAAGSSGGGITRSTLNHSAPASTTLKDEGTLESIIGGTSTTDNGSEEAPSALLDQTVHARQAISPWLRFRDHRLEKSYQVDYFVKVNRMTLMATNMTL
jgi:hypothetical protein